MSSRGFFIRIYCNLLVSEELVRFAALDPDLQHLRVEPAYSPGSGLNVKVRFGLKSKIIAFCQDPKQREEIQKERQKLEDTLTRYIEFFLCILSLFDRFRSGETNTVVSTNVIEEGLDVRSCNLVIKFDFPATFRWEFPSGVTFIRHLTSQLGPGRTCRAKEELERSPVGTSSWQARRKPRKLRQNSTSLEELKGWRSRNATSLKTMKTR